MIKIKIVFDLKISKTELDQIPPKSGLYVLFDKKRKPLYVGISSDLKTRISHHFKGLSNTSRYASHFDHCSIVFEDCESKKRACEYYLINTLKTPLNLSKNGHSLYSATLPNEARCNGITLKGERCKQRAHGNGYCHLHGGDGVTKSSIIEKVLQEIQM